MKRFLPAGPTLWLASLAAASTILAAPGVLAQTASSPAKKELVAKVLQLNQPGVDLVARALVEQATGQIGQQIGAALQRAPADKREALGRELQGDLKRFFDETLPPVRERAQRLAPTTVGALLEERFDEAELRQVVAMLESPIFKKYQTVAFEMQRSLGQKLAEESRPLLQQRAQAIEQTTRKRFADAGVAISGTPAAPGPTPAPGR